jgi:hypothetical protein
MCLLVTVEDPVARHGGAEVYILCLESVKEGRERE